MPSTLPTEWLELNAIQIYTKICGRIYKGLPNRSTIGVVTTAATRPSSHTCWCWPLNEGLPIILNYLQIKCSISKCIEDNSYLKINTKSISLHRTRKKGNVHFPLPQLQKYHLTLVASVTSQYIILNKYQSSPRKTHKNQLEAPRLKTFLAYGLHDKADGRKARCGHCLTSVGFWWVLFQVWCYDSGGRTLCLP